jgi:hypothetical protein
MPTDDSPVGTRPERLAQDAADHLATALEEVGFDVGREFTMLQGRVDLDRTPRVDVGRISTASAARLVSVLVEAAQRGITVAAGDGG